MGAFFPSSFRTMERLRDPYAEDSLPMTRRTKASRPFVLGAACALVMCALFALSIEKTSGKEVVKTTQHTQTGIPADLGLSIEDKQDAKTAPAELGESCFIDSHCGSGYCHLSTSGGVCTEKFELGATCGANVACLSGYCTNRFIGTTGVCAAKEDNGAACTTGVGCNSGYCNAGLLGGAGTCVACLELDDCGTTSYCSSYQCVELLGNSADCTSDLQCASGHCSVILLGRGKCVSCSSSDHCPRGHRCSDNQCVEGLPLESVCAFNYQCASSNCHWFHCKP
eukprot:c52241_g1_i1.p1 GENE.c52241_g1_i1~~c52241_g1_i1.p1  ORF type:complete len:282 (-),score=30.60 c52241_g1_i1:70-915(-)